MTPSTTILGFRSLKPVYYFLQRYVLKYERLLKNTRRPEVLIKEIKVSLGFNYSLNYDQYCNQ